MHRKFLEEQLVSERQMPDSVLSTLSVAYQNFACAESGF